MTSAITATGLRKSFGGKIVLDGIDLEVGAGTTFSLLSPNGAERPPPFRSCPRWCTRTAARPSRSAATPPTATSPSAAPDSLLALEKKGNHDHQPIPAGDRRGRATTAGQRHRVRRRRRHRK